MKIPHLKIAFPALLFFAVSCSSAPSRDAPSAGPDWVRQPSRTVDAGYIVYIGMGEDRLPEKALFKAESAAMQDLANECSFAPKGARIEDHFSRELGIVHQVYVKMAVDFQSCEGARAASQPEEIKKLANLPMTEQIHRYQEQLASAGDSQAVASSESDTNPELKNPSGPTVNEPAEARPGPRVLVIRDEPGFYFARQQVVYLKQTVILSPPNAYPPQSPQAAQMVQSLQTPSQQIRNYEEAHPEIRQSPTSYTAHVRQQEAFRKSSAPSALPGARTGRVGPSGGAAGAGTGGARSGGKGSPKRKRRHR